MKAVRLVAYGDSSQIKYEDIPQPSPGPGEVLVKVAASGLNHVETYLRQGYLAQMMPLELPAILGIDLAGEVAELGPGVTQFAKGDRVIGRLAINGKGSHAEYAVAAATQLARLPANVSFEAGAVLPLAGLTGRQAVDAAGVKPGDRVLVTGALGSVGRVAVQYLKELGIGAVAGVQASQVLDAKALGLEAIVPGASVLERSFDAAVETVGGDVAAVAIRSVKDGGTVVGTAGFPEGANADGRVKVVPLSSGDDPGMLQEVADAAGRGELQLSITRTFPLEQLRQAYDFLATRPEGKVVITR
jgi:NADPH:quinone reductase-like Zn-dependent oxidoreductase